jgi:hypothetical protein
VAPPASHQATRTAGFCLIECRLKTGSRQHAGDRRLLRYLTASRERSAGLFPAVSVSITPDGTRHLVAAKSSVVSLFLRAQQTKLPASVRWVAWPSPSHASMSPCLAFSRVSPRTAS